MGVRTVKIAVCTIGSRGDILPFLVLADALTKRGHEVRLATAGMYASLASRYDVVFVPFKGDYAAFVESGETKKAIGGNPLTAGKRLREKLYPIIEHSLDTFFDVALWADRVIYHPKTLVDAFGSKFPQKLIKAYVVPAFTPTAAFPSPIYSGLPIPWFLYKATYRITRLLTFTVRRPIQAFYAKHRLNTRFKTLDAPTIYGNQPAPCPKALGLSAPLPFHWILVGR